MVTKIYKEKEIIHNMTEYTPLKVVRKIEDLPKTVSLEYLAKHGFDHVTDTHADNEVHENDHITMVIRASPVYGIGYNVGATWYRKK